MNKTLVSVLGVAALAATSAQAEVTGNIGWDSEYIFRGVPQSDSSANGGVDWEGDSGFYVGTWAADVDEGLEIDYYGGYAGEIGDFGYYVGATFYDYTDNFDEEYLEANLGLSWKWFSFDAAIGEYDSQPDEEDYQFYSLTGEINGLYATIGVFADDFDGEYYEVGYTTEIATVDVTGAYIYSTSDLVDGVGGITGSDSNIIIKATKSFSFDDVKKIFTE